MGLDIRYARSGGVSIAYQVVGDGDVDLIYVPDYISKGSASCTRGRSPGSPW